ncbi:class I SAM-dependent methyltransferase [Candidatus Woesearchaeota archaeon]|nr:class I SAM-dependent methyltransferase [Candidatus Woesearchaeota archaeon]
MFKRFIKKLALGKAGKIAGHCSSYVGKSLLDVGAGRGFIAKEIQARTGASVTCIDIKDLNESGLPYIVYDGKKLPFKDASYDTALAVYVLHHCEDPLAVLDDVIRVAAHRIIIFEDVPSFMTKLLDYIANKLHGVDTPFNFKQPEEWERIFAERNLAIVKKELDVEKQWFYPGVTHVMYVLDKT